MALVKIALTAILFYCLNATKIYWYFLISWLVNFTVIASISWWAARKITRDFLCKTILPRVDPSGKAVLITGCDSGFGHMTAIELNKLGFFVFATCLDTNGEGAKQLLTNAPHRNRITTIQMNVTNPDEISAAFTRVQQVLSNSKSGTSELYAIVNNAGIAIPTQIEWARANSVDPYDLHIDVNTMGVIRVTRKFLPLIRQSKGRIVNLSSLTARTNVSASNPYCVSKAATSKFTEGLQEELAPFGVTSIDINPWFYKTPLLNPRNLIPIALQKFNESTEEVRNTYGQEGLRKVVKKFATFGKNPLVTSRYPEKVVEAIVDAITSAEPDAVYRVMAPGTKEFFWMTNDFLPWELVIYSRRLVNKLIDLNDVDVDKYLGDSMVK